MEKFVALIPNVTVLPNSTTGSQHIVRTLLRISLHSTGLQRKSGSGILDGLRKKKRGRRTRHEAFRFGDLIPDAYLCCKLAYITQHAHLQVGPRLPHHS